VLHATIDAWLATRRDLLRWRHGTAGAQYIARRRAGRILLPLFCRIMMHAMASHCASLSGRATGSRDLSRSARFYWHSAVDE
jgi:hypothetical protein